MSAYRHLTPEQARTQALPEHTHLAIARIDGGQIAYLARDYMEAMRWLNFQRHYIYPGTDRIERI